MAVTIIEYYHENWEVKSYSRVQLTTFDDSLTAEYNNPNSDF